MKACVFYLWIFEISYSCAMGDNEYRRLRANTRIFCNVKEGFFVSVLKDF